MIDLKEAVALGAAWLDEIHSGWHKKIDPFALDMRDMAACVLGQLYGDMGTGMEQKQNATWEFWLTHGIIIPNANNYKQQYNVLTEHWRRQIEERNR